MSNIMRMRKSIVTAFVLLLVGIFAMLAYTAQANDTIVNVLVYAPNSTDVVSNLQEAAVSSGEDVQFVIAESWSDVEATIDDVDTIIVDSASVGESEADILDDVFTRNALTVVGINVQGDQLAETVGDAKLFTDHWFESPHTDLNGDHYFAYRLDLSGTTVDQESYLDATDVADDIVDELSVYTAAFTSILENDANYSDLVEALTTLSQPELTPTSVLVSNNFSTIADTKTIVLGFVLTVLLLTLFMFMRSAGKSKSAIGLSVTLLLFFFSMNVMVEANGAYYSSNETVQMNESIGLHAFESAEAYQGDDSYQPRLNFTQSDLSISTIRQKGSAYAEELTEYYVNDIQITQNDLSTVMENLVFVDNQYTIDPNAKQELSSEVIQFVEYEFRGMNHAVNFDAIFDEASIDYIDMETDLDGDGLPDELVREMSNSREQVRQMVEQHNLSDTDELNGLTRSRKQTVQQLSSAVNTTVGSVLERVPYMPATRLNQAHLGRLVIEVSYEEDEAKAELLHAEIGRIQAELDNDPMYAIVMQTIESLASHDRDTVSTRSSAKGSSEKQVGDIYLTRNDSFELAEYYVKDYSHSAIYAGNNQLYESVTGGVFLRGMNSVNASSNTARLRAKSNTDAVVTSLGNIQERYGFGGETDYNVIFPNKWKDKFGENYYKVYCSQLVWKLFKDHGKNVDSQNWNYMWYMSTKYFTREYIPEDLMGKVPRWFVNWATRILAGNSMPFLVFLGVAPDEIYYDRDLQLQ